ncbi:zinc knuckle [Ancylostoma caninum]|uniref:Zinc knuckle n=1 Tax=Ancylostoma caninum TaxID=29170 RepID=A0A368GWI7_ANCCA|nr:zinc knuckle [Ancylostoma caninum]
MAAHEGENQGTVQPKEGLPRNQVSEMTSQDWGVVRVSEELERVICKIEQLPQLISENLAETRIAGKYRSQMMTVIENQAKAVCLLLGELKKSTQGYSQFGKELFRALQFKGVESMDDLNDFLTTTERDGELLSEICGMFNTDVLQVRDVLGEIKQLQNSRQARSQSAQEEKMDVSQENGQFNSDVIGIVDDRQVNYSERFQMRTERPATRLTGVAYGQHSKQHSEPWDQTDTEDRGQAYKLLAYMQANTCVSPGIFKGMKHENFEEFIRRFGRKYKGVIMDDHTLIEISGDDHLEGRSKNVFLSIPEEVRGQGFRAVVDELRRLLANDSMAGRLRALTELRTGFPRREKPGPQSNNESRAGVRGNSEQRRCYNCNKFGHIGRECPLKQTQVKQIGSKQSKREQSQELSRLAQISAEARSLGVRVTNEREEKRPLVGGKFSVWVKLLNTRLPAILDTGSMINIIPVGVLARAKDTGADVDRLEVIPENEMVPVYDASNNRMDFMGAVKIE